VAKRNCGQCRQTFASECVELSSLARRLGQLDKAIADCTQSLYLNDKTAAAYFTRAQAYQRQNRLSMALRDMETVLREVDPQNRLAYERMEQYKFGE